MDYGRASLKRKWIGLNPSCPEFVPQQPMFYNNTQLPPQHPAPGIPGWVPRGNTTWQYNVYTNRVVGGYYPQIRTKGAYLYDLDAVPFDPNVDVPIKVCFNCWSLEHPQQKCPQPKCHNYCNNCGRINVTVDKCPRCARAYNRYLLEKQARKNMEFHSSDGNLDKEVFEPFIQNQKLDDHSQKNETFSENSNVSSVANQTEEGYFSNDGSENFDDYVVDEDITSDEYTSGFVRDFMLLMDTVKHLPLETQNDVVQQFLAERQKQLQN